MSIWIARRCTAANNAQSSSVYRKLEQINLCNWSVDRMTMICCWTVCCRVELRHTKKHHVPEENRYSTASHVSCHATISPRVSDKDSVRFASHRYRPVVAVRVEWSVRSGNAFLGRIDGVSRSMSNRCPSMNEDEIWSRSDASWRSMPTRCRRDSTTERRPWTNEWSRSIGDRTNENGLVVCRLGSLLTESSPPIWTVLETTGPKIVSTEIVRNRSQRPDIVYAFSRRSQLTWKNQWHHHHHHSFLFARWRREKMTTRHEYLLPIWAETTATYVASTCVSVCLSMLAWIAQSFHLLFNTLSISFIFLTLFGQFSFEIDIRRIQHFGFVCISSRVVHASIRV